MSRWSGLYLLLPLLFVQTPGQTDTTQLGVHGTQFTLNGEATFLLGMSYYGALGASEDTIREDLDDLERLGFNWIRVWVTWAYFGVDVSAVDTEGKPRETYMHRLEWLVAECDGRGMIVDITLTRGSGQGSVHDIASHRRAVEALVTPLRAHGNWYIDLANECDVGDARYVSFEQIRELRDLVKSLDPQRLVTASFSLGAGGEQYVRNALVVTGLDLLTPHLPRYPGTQEKTAQQTRDVLAAMQELGQVAPLHYQEPFRRDYSPWQPAAEDFLTDLRGAVEAGAAGWCLHNGSTRSSEDGKPRRSFDMSEARLFDQLDEEEMEVAAAAAGIVKQIAEGQ